MFDTHCHFDTIEDAREQLSRAYELGLKGINVIGCDLKTSILSIDVVKMAHQEREVLGLGDLDIKATVGLHPHEAKHYENEKLELEELIDQNKDYICAIGETGYDFYYSHSEESDQTQAFNWQIDLAKNLDLAMVIHTRNAWDETFERLKTQGWPNKTVMHCFTGGPDEALKSVENGAYISISGISTFKNAQDIRDAIEQVPLERLLVETDAPWLAPVPHRGKPNEPSYLGFVIDQVVDIRKNKCGDDETLVRQALIDNALKLFR